MSDINENIDFRPLSEGLGFHQKKNPNASENLGEVDEDFDVPSVDLDVGFSAPKTSSPNTYSAESPRTISLQPEMEPVFKPAGQDEVDVSSLKPVWMQPAQERYNPWAGDVDIGREPTVDGVVEGDMENSTVIDNPFFIPQKISSPVEVITLRFSGHDGLRNKKYKPMLSSFSAIMMDVLTLVSICMIFFAMVLTAMGESLSVVLAELPNDATQRSYFLGIVLTVSFMYMILSRCLVGRTIGEWMFLMQLGTDEDQSKPSYPIKVFIRTTVVVLSGFITFPILSRLVNKDLLAYFSGVEMHGEKTEAQNQNRADHEFNRYTKK